MCIVAMPYLPTPLPYVRGEVAVAKIGLLHLAPIRFLPSSYLWLLIGRAGRADAVDRISQVKMAVLQSFTSDAVDSTGGSGMRAAVMDARHSGTRHSVCAFP